VIDWITRSGVRHLNISRAHPDDRTNGRLMGLDEQLDVDSLRQLVKRARGAGTRVRLSCVLLREAIADLDGVLAYLDFARSLGVDNVVFRQLMHTDPTTHTRDFVVAYCDRQRAPLAPIVSAMSSDPRFSFARQIVGYYYYVEVWRYNGVDVVCEAADLAELERSKQRDPGLIHELVFHPNARLASTWQSWDGVLGPW
jgi:GTP 3',8-cyclase